MDTPTIAAFYREVEPNKRCKLLEQSIAAGEEPEKNAIRKEICSVRYFQRPDSKKSGDLADGYFGLWMNMEFNRGAANKFTGKKRARKDILAELEKMQIPAFRAKGPEYEELLYQELCHLVRVYIEMCQTDRNYNSTLFGLMRIGKDSAAGKLRKDIYETAIELPETLELQEELGMLVRAAKEVYASCFPDESPL